jgi:prevent-host-death family protein
MLSYGYTILCHEAIAVLEAAGLDPMVGFLHQHRWGRPALAAADRLALPEHPAGAARAVPLSSRMSAEDLVQLVMTMREMTAVEALRNFSAVLDEAERGEAIVVTRGGRRVAMIVPAPRANGGALREVVGRWCGNVAFDETFASNVAGARGGGCGSG